MGPEVHAGRVEPHKKRFIVFCGALNELLCAVQKLEVDGLHALLVERARIRHAPIGKTVHHTARPKTLAEGWVLRLVRIFGLFLGVQVI